MSNNWLQRKLGLLPEGADQGGAALTAPQLSPGFASQVPKVFGAEVGQSMAFEMAPDVFDRIEFWGVGRQAGQNDVALGPLDTAPHRTTAMHCQPVPDHQQFAGNLAAEVAEKLRGLSAFDAAAIEAKIKLPPGNPGQDGEFAPGMTENQLRGLPFGSPSAYDTGALRKTAFINKDNRSAFLQGLFFSAGQECFFQRAIAASSRCTALPAGRCMLQPIRPNTRQTWPGCRRTPLWRWISSATRGNVQRSLRKPWAWAPCNRAFSSCCWSPGLSLGRRPKGRRFHAAPRTDLRCCSQRIAVGRLTPHCRPTSAWEIPRPKSRIPSRRRCSIPSRSRLVFVLMREECVTHLCESQ